jgi:hypothetical protein
MKAKLELTKEQVDKLVLVEEKHLKEKFEKDLASIRTKYQIIEIDLDAQSATRKTIKVKLTDDIFKSYIDTGMKIADIAKQTGYNLAYLRKLEKRIFAVK